MRRSESRASAVDLARAEVNLDLELKHHASCNCYSSLVQHINGVPPPRLMSNCERELSDREQQETTLELLWPTRTCRFPSTRGRVATTPPRHARAANKLGDMCRQNEGALARILMSYGVSPESAAARVTREPYACIGSVRILFVRMVLIVDRAGPHSGCGGEAV